MVSRAKQSNYLACTRSQSDLRSMPTLRLPFRRFWRHGGIAPGLPFQRFGPSWGGRGPIRSSHNLRQSPSATRTSPKTESKHAPHAGQPFSPAFPPAKHTAPQTALIPARVVGWPLSLSVHSRCDSSGRRQRHGYLVASSMHSSANNPNGSEYITGFPYTYAYP